MVPQVGERMLYNIGILSENCSKTKKYYVKT
jgi:predicted DNA-binding protein